VLVTLQDIAKLEPGEALAKLDSAQTGLTQATATERLKTFGPNAIHTHHFTVFSLLLRQFRNPILALLAAAAGLAAALGDVGNASVIAVILTLSVALSLSTEYRAERASADLQSRNTHQATVLRDGTLQQVDVTQLVPGDLVRLSLGALVPADLRLIETNDLECDESIITGESMPVTKTAAAGEEGGNCALMGTVVRGGSGLGVVVRTGGSTEFGVIAQRLSDRVPETDFQRGLRRFSLFLLRLAVGMMFVVIIGNALLGKNLIESVLFALACAVGLTPQLLPAVVSTALALGSRQLAKDGVLVKRLVSIEDLGDLDLLITDKTGTLTAGAVSFDGAIAFGDLAGRDAAGRDASGGGTAGSQAAEYVTRLGMLATDVDYAAALKSTAGLNPLDAALWSAASASATLGQTPQRLDAIAFDHDRRIASSLVMLHDTPTLISKGSAEDLIGRCIGVTDQQRATLTAEYAKGARVIAVASKAMPAATTLTKADETGLTLQGLLTFADPVKLDVQESLAALANLGIEVKIATGDSPEVAATVCAGVGLKVGTILTGKDIEAMDDLALAKAVVPATVFARVSPEQKARIIRALRADGKAVGFLGDGVNDAIALHDADVGISVDSATDVAKDAADVVLLQKDLGVLATGVRQGRRVFSNTMKYVLMGTSSNFGNIVSAAGGSLILKFLPMAPSQLLLQDLLYDSSQLALPTDNVDAEQTARPSHWKIDFIRKFMIVMGLASSLFDFATFGLMSFVFHAKASEFQTGWFVESLATATLIVFAIRTRRVPFLRSKPSLPMAASVIGTVALGAGITYSPVGALLGFSPLPPAFFGALLGMIAAYLVIVEFAKWAFFGWGRAEPATAKRAPKLGPHVPNQYHRGQLHRVHRRSSRFITHQKPAAKP